MHFKQNRITLYRQNPEYQEALGKQKLPITFWMNPINPSLGQTIHNVIKNIPGGVLVFFPCYKMIEEVVTTWKVYFLMNNRIRRFLAKT